MKTGVFLIGLLFSQIAHSAIKTVEIGDYEIEYDVSGSGSEVVLLEAGARGGIADWGNIWTSLSEVSTVIRYSRVGNGNSSKPETMFVVEDYANHLKSLLDHLGVHKIIHVAHSYGGTVARVFAAKYPDRVEGILLVDASSEHDVDIMRAINLEQANKEIAAIKLADIEDGKNHFIVDFWAKFPLPDYPEIKDIPITVIASVKRYESPAHLLHSDKGVAMWGEHWKEWAESFPQGEVVLTANSHHLIPQEEPSLVINEAKKLIERVRANTYAP
ncbi:alpha/beta fold hydrolase [Thalassotalea ganghwensis]